MRRIIVAGEAGGSVAATRHRISEAWNGAEISDHHGMTEVGPVSYGCPAQPGRLHVIEASYLAEIVDPAGSAPLTEGTAGELILTLWPKWDERQADGAWKDLRHDGEFRFRIPKAMWQK